MNTGFVAYDELQVQLLDAETRYNEASATALGFEAMLTDAMLVMKAIVESRVNMKLNVNNNRRADFVREEQQAFDRAHELLGEYYGTDA